MATTKNPEPLMSKRILFVGGGSGGHINPLLAVVAAVQQANPRVECHYAGLKSDIESPLIQTTGLQLQMHPIVSGKLHRFFTWDQLRQLGNLARGFVVAWLLLKKVKPDLVFAKGSFVGLPLVTMAAWMRIPVFSHETDAALGLANRFMTRYAQKIFTGYPVEHYKNLPKEKLFYVGQPVRPEFYDIDIRKVPEIAGRSLERDLPVITIIGGSQGAHQINMFVQTIWSQLLQKVQLVHIAGRGDFPWLQREAQALSPELQERLFLADFLAEQIPYLFHASDLVISRSGGTIFELAACRTPSLLIPYSAAAQNHQWVNARIMLKASAAVVLDEQEITAEELLAKIEDLLQNTKLRTQLAENIAQFDHPEAAEQMAAVLLEEL